MLTLYFSECSVYNIDTMKEIRLPEEFSFIRHTEATSDMQQETEGLPRLTERGRQQAVQLGEVALLDKISGQATVRLITAPGVARETASRAYGGPMWIDDGLRDPDSRHSERSAQAYGRDEISQVATSALSAVMRLRANFKSEIYPVAVTTGTTMSAVRNFMEDEAYGHMPHEIESGAIDTYKVEDDGSVLLRTTPLGQDPQKSEFLLIKDSLQRDNSS